MDEEDFLSNLNGNLMLKPVNELKNDYFISDVASGKIKFITVVESIQGVLTNKDVNVRERGIDFLSWVLSELPPDLFSGAEITVIVNFYCDSLKGHHSGHPATFRGLLAVMKMKNIGKSDVFQILVHLFQNVNCRTQLQADRYNLFSILKLVVENHLEDLKPMGPDLVFGLISFIEGETEPTCLLLIFNFLPSFIRNFPLGHLAEEMFEILSCYFPIDFNAAAKDDTVITREDLAEGLAECLSASDCLSEQCLPVILEKLDSTFKTAKLDSYKLLQECCKTLRVESVEKNLSELWKSIQKDVLPGNDKRICEAGLSALSDLVGLLSREEQHESILSTFLDDILTTAKTLIKRVDENLFQPGVKVLVSVSGSSKMATSRTLSYLKPCYQAQSSVTLMERKIVLSSLLPLLKICREHRMSSSENSEDSLSYLELVSFYLNSMASVDHDVRKLAFTGVSLVVSDMSLDFRRRLYENVVDNIKTKEDIKTSEELLVIWRQLAQDHDTEFHEVLSNYFQLSSDQTEPYADRFLWALSLIADLPSFTGFVVPVFLAVITKSRRHVAGLESLLNACRFAKKNSSSDFFHVIHAEHNILERLIFWWLESGEEIRSSPENSVLFTLSNVIALVTRNQYSYAQQIVIDKFMQLFLKEAPPLNGGGDFRTPVESLLKDSSIDVVDMVVILEAVLGSVRPEVTIPTISNLTEKLTSLALTSSQDPVRLSSSRLLASIVNKSKETLASELSVNISKAIFEQLEENSAESRLKCNSAFLFTWLVKGVILKGGQSCEEWISTWFDLLGRKDIGEAIAEGFRIVMEEDDLYLNLDSHNNVKVLYRQRLFGYFPKLLKMYESSDESVKMNYLLALVRLLQGVPSHLVKTEISSIAVLLAQCLSTEKQEVLLTSLQISGELLESREPIFSDHIQSFVPRFLKLSRFKDHMKIRMNALKCLYHYGFYPTFVLLPIKNQVIHDLESCLDDKKRLVRKEAVRARCRWFLVGAPGEDILDS